MKKILLSIRAILALKRNGIRSFGILLLCSASIFLSACKPELVTQPYQAFPTLTAWVNEKKATITYDGLPGKPLTMDTAFKQGYILTYGEGLPRKDAKSGQRRLTAQRAAEVVAQRNLAYVLSQAGQHGSVRFDNYSSPFSTALKGFQIVSKEYSDEAGKAAVLLRYDLRGAKAFVH